MGLDREIKPPQRNRWGNRTKSTGKNRVWMHAVVARLPRSRRRRTLALVGALTLALASLTGLYIVATAHAGNTCTWVGGNGNWSTSNTAGWSGCGGLVPQAADDVVISSADTVIITGIVSVNSITVNNASAVLTQNSSNTVTTAAGFTLTAGTFNQSASATVTVNGAFLINGGTYTGAANTLTVGGNFTVSSGTFTPSTGTVVFSGGASTIGFNGGSAGSVTFNAVTFNPSTAGAIKTVDDNDTLIVGGLLTLTEGSINQTTAPAGGTIAARGAITVTNTNLFDDSSGTIVVDGTGTQTFTGSATATAGNLPNIIINKPSGTLNFSGTVRTLRDWTYTAGTLGTMPSNIIFSKSTGSPQTYTGSATFTGVIIQGSGTSGGLAVAGGTTLTASGTLSLRDGILASGTIDATGPITLNPTALLSFDGGAGTVHITSTAAQTFTGTAIAGSSLPNVNIDKASNTLTLAGTIRTGNNWTYTSGTVAPGTSTMDFAGGNTITGSQTFNNVTFSGADANYSIPGGTTVTATGTTLLTDGFINGAGTYAAQGAVTQQAAFDGGSGNLTFSGSSATITGNASGSAGSLPAVTIAKGANTLTISGTLRTTNNWTYTSGTLSGGTVVFSAPTAGLTITGNQTLNNVNFSGADTKSATIASGTTVTAQGSTTLSDGTLDGAGTLAAQGAISQASTFDGGTGNLLINGSNSPTFTGSATTDAGDLPANITINKSGTLTLAGTIRTSGTWTYTAGTVAAGGLFVSAGATFSGAQSLSLSSLDIRGATTISTATLTVGGTLTLTTGKVTTGANKLIVSSTGSVSGGSASSYVFGNLQEHVDTNGSTVTWPIGGMTNYTPAQLVFTGVTNAGDLTLKTTAADHPNLATSPISNTKYIKRYWSATASGGLAGGTYDLKVTFVDSDKIGAPNTAALRIAKWNGASWSPILANGAQNANDTTATGISGFSDFIVGESGVVPTKLVITSAPPSATAATNFSITVEAQDDAGTPAPVSQDTGVSLSVASGAGGTLSGNTGTILNGASSVTLPNVQYTKAGALTLTAATTSGDVLTTSIASTSISVAAGAFTKLQLLMPGETAAPGSATGKTGTPTNRTASVSFNVTVNAVDANWNLVNVTDTVGITSTDPNNVLPADAALVGGTADFAVTLKTAGSRTVTATDITDGGKSPNTSPATTVDPGPFVKLQLLVPGETAAPGTASGKTGAPTARTAGTQFAVTVNAVDADWNVVSSATDTIAITSSDANAALPANAALVAGTKNFNVTFKTAAAATITATDATDAGKTASTSPSIAVDVGAFSKLQLLMPGESAAPGTASGKTGTPTAQTAAVAFSVTVNAVDDNWNLVNTVTHNVGITSSDANAMLPSNDTLVDGTKTYSVTFKTANGTKTVTATDITDGTKTANTGTPTTVNPGAFVKLQLLVPGEAADPGSPTGKTGAPTDRAAASPFSVTVNGVDANWNKVASVTDTVAITSTAGDTTLPANAALVAGTQDFNVTFHTVGSAQLTASDATDGGKTANLSPPITVGPGVASQLVITAVPVGSVTAGTNFSVTVRTKDADGNIAPVTGDTTFDLSASSGAGGTFTNATGTITAGSSTRTLSTVQYTRAGTVTLLATRTSGDSLTTSPASGSFTVDAATISKLQLLMPGETAAPGTASGKTGTPTTRTAGTAFTVTVNAVDDFWNLVPSTRTVAITSSDANAALPLNAALVAGTKDFSVTFKTAAPATVTATDTSGSPLTASTSPSTTVNAGAFVKLQLLVPGETAAPGTASGKTGAPTARTAGGAFTITANAVDANWNVVSSATDSIAITSSDANAALPANAALVSGTKDFSFTFKTAAAATITATDASDGGKTASTSSSITVNVGAFSKLQLLMPGETAAPGTASGKTGTPTARTAGTAFNVTVNAVDDNWNLVSSTDNVTITTSDANDTEPGAATLVAGTKNFSVTLKTAASTTVTATDSTDGGKSPNTSPSTTVNAGAFVKLQLLVPGEVAAPGTATGKTGATPSSQFTETPFSVIVNAVDANWNVVASAPADTIHIASSDGAATLPANAALSSGTRSFNVTFKTAGSQTVTASDVTDGAKTASTSPSITAIAAARVDDVTAAAQDGSYAAGAVLHISVVFDIAVNVTGGVPTLLLETGTTDHTATYVSGSGSTTLVFDYTVQAGDTTSDLNYASTSALSLAGAAIKDNTLQDANLTLPALGGIHSLAGHAAIVLDTTGPVVTNISSPDANGNYAFAATLNIAVTFNEPVTVTGTPTLLLETGTVDRTANYSSGSGTSTLTFVYVVQAGDDSNDLDEASAGALALSGGTLKDSLANNATLTVPAPGAAGSLGANKNITVVTSSPTLIGGNVGGTNHDELSLTFNRTLAGTTTPGSSMTVNGSTTGLHTCTGNIGSLPSATPTCTLDTAVAGSETLTVTYTQPGGAANLTDAPAGGTANLVAAFGPTSITNGVVDTTAPSISSMGSLNGTSFTITMTEALKPGQTLQASSFTVKFNGVAQTVSTVSYNGAVITVTVASAPTDSQTVTVGYNPAALTSSQTIRDTAGNDTAQFVNQPVTNTTPDSVAPTTVSRTINGSALTLTYSEALDTGSTPAPARFLVTVNGAPVTVQSVNVSGSNVVLTLDSPVIASDTVTVVYTAGASPIRDASSNHNAAASDGSAQTVTNNTGVPPSPVEPPIGPPPTAPTLTGSSPADGATVASAFTVTLTASAPVYWTQVRLDFTPAGGATTTTVINDDYGASFNPPIFASSPGVYTLRGDMLNAGGRVPFSITFTIGGSGQPPANPGPRLTGAIPSDGTTVSSLTTLTLIASAAVNWTNMTLSYDPQTDGTLPTVSSLPSSTSTSGSLNVALNATALGLYTISGTISNATGSNNFDTHFSVYIPPADGGGDGGNGGSGTASDPPPTAVNVSSGTAGTLRASSGQQTIVWSPLSWPADAAELHIDPSPVRTAVGGFSAGGTSLDVRLITSSGSLIHTLAAPIEIVFDTTDATRVPTTSEDGLTWRSLRLLGADHVLPADQPDGYWLETLPSGTFRVHIFTRHLTLFALLKDTTAPAPPTQLTGAIGSDRVTLGLQWMAAIDNSGVIASYTVVIDGHAATSVPGTQTAATISPIAADDARVYQVMAQDTAGNSSPLSAGVTRVPSLVGMSLQAATAKIAQRGFTVGKVIQVTPGAGSSSTVAEQSVPPTAMVTVGTPIDLKVSDAIGHAQLAARVHSAKRTVYGGKRYISIRLSVTVPSRLTIYLADSKGKRYTHWVIKRVGAGFTNRRVLLPANVKLIKGHRYHLDLYFRGGGQRTVKHAIVR